MVVMDLIDGDTMMKIGLVIAAILFIVWGIAKKINSMKK
jgi:hypothetical protein